MGSWFSGPKRVRRKEEGLRRLDVRQLAQREVLQLGCTGFVKSLGLHVRYLSEDLLVLSYQHQGESLSYRVTLVRSPCHYGGQRLWLLCPNKNCAARVAVLFGARLFLCRHCHKLSYESQRQGKLDRVFAKRNKIWSKLKADPAQGEASIALAQKPKGMHWRTFEALKQKARWEQYQAILTIEKLLGTNLAPELES